jgi:hypothetical protein
MRRPFVAYSAPTHVLVVALTLQACTPRVAPSSAAALAARATFIADVPEWGEEVHREGGVPRNIAGGAAGSARPACLHATRFAGVVVPGSNDARVLISPAYVNVERRNDKQSDILLLRIEVAEPRHSLGTGSWVEYRVGPTVDTAGPSITTWRARDTIRVVVPWARGIGARWLMFYLSYRATSYDGKVSECFAILRSDTLRFDGETASSRSP